MHHMRKASGMRHGRGSQYAYRDLVAAQEHNGNGSRGCSANTAQKQDYARKT